MGKTIKIVLTGGPCGGKTKAIGFLKEKLELIGNSVSVISETATELLSEGFDPKDIILFHNELFSRQTKKEKLAEMSGADIILLDRGIIDICAYMGETEFEKLLENNGTDYITVRDSYDGVFHMVSAACYKNDIYKTNVIRKESVFEAESLDKKTLRAWLGHNHLRQIDVAEDFSDKLVKLLDEVLFFLGIPKKLEIERKFLIKYPDINYLEKADNCRKILIQQVYLTQKDGAARRIRKRGEGSNFSYFYTEKKKISSMVREENERIITKDEYEALLMEADPLYKPIEKSRYCLMENGKYFEIDVFPFWKDKAFLEIELMSENESFELPSFIEVIKDVTEDKNYTNYSLAKKP